VEIEGQDWTNKKWGRRFLQLISVLSLISVSCNTPQTFMTFPQLRIITYVCDWVCLLVFALELIIKVKQRGFLKRDGGYLRDRWGQFDLVMLLLIAVSILSHSLEFVGFHNAWFAILRAPRPIIMIRFIRASFSQFTMPKARLKQIFKRSSQQVYNVTLFFLFFMSLYGFLGVQLFGDLHNHCVRECVQRPEDVTINDLTIPDTYCKDKEIEHGEKYGYECPKGFKCMNMSNRSKYDIGFTGFGDMALSVFTVYQAASQEGWVYIMYRASDSIDPLRSSFYFITMIFFLAWMVKNVFIAVITEMFNEIRVQFQQMWGEREHIGGGGTQQILQADPKHKHRWQLVTVDEFRLKGIAPQFCHTILRSAVYHIIVMGVTVANAMVTATISFQHTWDERPREDFIVGHRKLEIGFVIFYNLEVVFKIFCLSFKGYISRAMHKFEFLLAIMTTLHVMPGCFLSLLSIFQVLRVVRLVKASPMLEDFVYKIFGPGKKLGSLILFTLYLLLITSAISMQLFCNLKNERDIFLENFSTFPFALMSMFQILTQEAWPEVMSKTMRLTPHQITPLVAVYFILYHLFVTLIVMSFFVAVILDNLELDEDAKKIKQLKLREDSSDIKEDLPLRLRFFEKFPERPLMAKLNKTPSDYVVPKIRESFLSKFIYQTDEFIDKEDGSRNIQPSLSDPNVRYRKNAAAHLMSNIKPMLRNAKFVKKQTVERIIQSVRRSVRGGSQIFKQRPGTFRIHETIKENGHIGMPPTTSTSVPSNPNSVRTQNLDIKLIQAKHQQAEMRRNRKEEYLRENHPFFDRPLFMVPRESKFRKVCRSIVNARYDAQLRNAQTGKERKVKFRTIHKLLGLVSYLDWIMIIITTLTTVSQLFETPHYRVMSNPELQIADYVFVTAMAIELTVKILAEGLIFTPNALLQNMSGVFDVLIFSVNLVWLAWTPHQVKPSSVAQMFMILRCFRPLRIFILVPHMRKVVSELCKGFKEIFLVAVLLIILMFIFANIGVHLFGMKFAACNDVTIRNRSECHGLYDAKLFVTKMNLQLRAGQEHPSLLAPRVWKNPRRFNFDNIGAAMLALFEVLSYKGWVDLRDVIVSKMGPVYAIYIHLYVFLGSMIGLTLFVGVVIANYRENKGTALLTVDQMRWSDLKKRLKIAQPLHVPPKPENNIFQACIYDVTQNVCFKRFIAILVLLNSLLLCVNWQEEIRMNGYITKAASALTSIFVVEVCMKMIAFSPNGYLHSFRNKFDLVVTLWGVVWIILHHSLQASNETIIIFGYLSIILRFLTITGKHATLSMLMQTVRVSVYKSFFIIMGMFTLITCYALIGVILFGNLKYGEAINRQANFATAGRGIVMLFRIVTGEDWNRILHDCMQKPPACTYRSYHNFWETNCGNFTGALLFFCSFYLIITYIVLNLLVAIIMENFSLFYTNEEDALLSHADIRNFQTTWNLVDVNQRGTIPVRRVKFILRLLKGRLEVDTQKDRLLFKHMCYELERLHNGEDVTFHDVLSMLSYRSIDIRKALQLEELLAREELEYIIEEEVAKLTIRRWLDGCLKRIREKEQTLLAGLRAMNEPLVSGLKPVSEDKEDETAYEGIEEIEEIIAEGVDQVEPVTRTDSVNSTNRRYLTPQQATSVDAWTRNSLDNKRGGKGRGEEVTSPGTARSSVCDNTNTGWRAAGTVQEVHAWYLRQLEIDSEADSD